MQSIMLASLQAKHVQLKHSHALMGTRSAQQPAQRLDHQIVDSDPPTLLPRAPPREIAQLLA